MKQLNLSKFKLPPAMQARTAALLQSAQNHAGPLGNAVAGVLKPLAAKLKTLGQTGLTPAVRNHRTVGSTFKHICVVGLNKSELLLGGENASLAAPSWQELTDDTMRNHLGMMFFAPRGLDGLPVDPYLFLSGETIVSASEEKEKEENAASTENIDMAQEQLAGFGMLDACRITPALPNTLNIVLAADVLFHWDVKDNYILPTTTSTWARDVEQILKTYPRTTRANIYTQWDTDVLPPNDRVSVFKLRDIPLDANMWINQPTWQEAHGNHILLGAIGLAGLVGVGLWFQHGQVGALDDDLRAIEQEIPKEGRFAELGKAISEQEKMLAAREMFFLTVKDTARAIENAEVKFDNFEIKTPDPQEPPTQLLITIETQKNAYNGWLEEEPVAKQLLVHSALLTGVRKPPSTVFRLEGLVDLPPLLRQYKDLSSGKTLAVTGSFTSSRAILTPTPTEVPEEPGEDEEEAEALAPETINESTAP